MNTQYATRYSISLTDRQPRRSYDLIVEPTVDTPFIKYSDDEKILMIKGNSMKLDMHTFYHSFTSRVWDNLEDHQEFKFYFYFRELNASTVKVLFDIFKRAWYKVQSGSQIEIYWGASDEDMLQTGKDFAELYDLNFQYVTAVK